MVSAPDLDCFTTPGNDLVTCVLDGATAGLGGQATFGLLVGSTALVGLWWANEQRLGTPAVVILIAGSLLLPILPSQYATVARSIAFVGLVAAILRVAQRYFLDPSI